MKTATNLKIAVADLCLSDAIHETVNLGFLYGVSLIKQQESFPFYADIGHFSALHSTINRRQLPLQTIVHQPIKVVNSYSLTHYQICKKSCLFILNDLCQKNIDTLLILSTVSFQRTLLKRLLKRKQFQHIHCIFVFHGDLDLLAGYYPQPTPISSLNHQPKKRANLSQNIKRIVKPKRVIHQLKSLSKRFAARVLNHRLEPLQALYQDHSSRIQNLVLSEHILIELQSYLDTEKLNFVAFPHPAVYHSADSYPLPANSYIKFAIFGYGNVGLLQQLNLELEKQKLIQNYEIRIIGSNHQGTAPFSRVTTPIQGRMLTRQEMEELAQDIDVFLILYESDRYRLSCSGTIIEALSHYKPIFYLENSCIQHFATKENNIGICCKTVSELAERMSEYINTYPQMEKRFLHFRQQINQVREHYNVEQNLGLLEEILSTKATLPQAR